MAGEAFDSRVRRLFDAALHRVLADGETVRDLEKLVVGGIEGERAAIRAELLASRDEFLGSTQVTLDRWKRARDRLQLDLLGRLSEPSFWLLVVLLLGTVVLAAHFVSELFKGSALVSVVVPAILVPAASALFRGVPTPYELAAYLIQERRARSRFIESLEVQLGIAVREAINERLISFDRTFRIFDRRGLRQLADPDREVPTDAADELKGLITSLDSGSIGLAGPRGSGKTTLIRSFTEGRSRPFDKPRVGLTVAAPVRYDPREFILHLFASLCEAVLANRPQALLQGGARWAHARRRRGMRLTLLLAVVLILAGIGLQLDWDTPDRQQIGLSLALIGTLLVTICLAVLVRRSELILKFGTPWVVKILGFPFPIPEITVSSAPPVEAGAKDYLKQIRFQQSQEANGSAEVGFPLGIGVGAGASTTLSRTPWTLPEAVEEFRRFAGSLGERFVVIGIDELDKMESDAAAREFLNNVKGVFGVHGCYFLVSVSEDAMSAFERRGLPMRDVFDSSFDEIQRIGYLDLGESRRVLESRVTGVPVPFQCLCHCLAGGLPRDLIRAIRELVYHYDAEITPQGSKDASLDNLTRLLIKAEWEGKVAGAIAATRSMAATQPWWLSEWLHEMSGGEPVASALRDWTLKVSHTVPARDGVDGDDADQFRQVAVEMMTFNYYAATLLDYFSATGVGGNLEDPQASGKLRTDAVEKLETLTKARQQFATDPRLSWQLIEQARAAAGLPRW